MRKRNRFQNPKPTPRKSGGIWVWYGQWRDDTGKRGKILGPKSQMTESQAKAALAAIVFPFNAVIGQPAKPVYTFRQYVKDVFIPFRRRGWKTSTDGTTVQQICCHLVPELGDLVLNAIGREDLQALLDRKALGLSRSVVSHLRWSLNSIYKLAESDGLVLANPASELIVPKHCQPGRGRRSLTLDQIDSYLAVLRPRECLAAMLALIEGMRPGEFLARRWPDLDRELMRVDSRIYRGEFDTPKNGKARESALNDETLLVLAELRKEALDPQGFIFPSETGKTPISRDNLWRRHMKPALDKVGLGWATFQVLRRTNATLGQKEGVDPKVFADQRGHGLGVSMEVYTISDLQQKREAVNRLYSAVIRKQRQKQSA